MIAFLLLVLIAVMVATIVLVVLQGRRLTRAEETANGARAHGHALERTHTETVRRLYRELRDLHARLDNPRAAPAVPEVHTRLLAAVVDAKTAGAGA